MTAWYRDLWPAYCCLDDVALLTTIRDNVETLFDMMVGIGRNPEVVA